MIPDELKELRKKETAVCRQAAKNIAAVLNIGEDDVVVLSADEGNVERGFHSVLHLSKQASATIDRKNLIAMLGIGCTRIDGEDAQPTVINLSNAPNIIAQMRPIRRAFEFMFDNDRFVPTGIRVEYQDGEPAILLDFCASDKKAAQVKEVLNGRGKGFVTPIKFINDLTGGDGDDPNQMKEQTFDIEPKPNELRKALELVLFGVETLQQQDKTKAAKIWSPQSVMQAYDKAASEKG